MPLVAWSPRTQASRAEARAVSKFEVEIQTLRRFGPREDLAVRCSSNLPFVFGCQSASAGRRNARERAGTRVPGFDLVELIGVEPTTSSLQSWRSTN